MVTERRQALRRAESEAVNAILSGASEDDVAQAVRRGVERANVRLSAPRRRAALARPDGSDPASHYREVAAAYLIYSQTSRAPSVEMANEAGVPVTTAHRWVREARRRGYLPAGRMGRVG